MVPTSAYVLIWAAPVITVIFGIFLYVVGGKWLKRK